MKVNVYVLTNFVKRSHMHMLSVYAFCRLCVHDMHTICLTFKQTTISVDMFLSLPLCRSWKGALSLENRNRLRTLMQWTSERYIIDIAKKDLRELWVDISQTTFLSFKCRMYYGSIYEYLNYPYRKTFRFVQQSWLNYTIFCLSSFLFRLDWVVISKHK